MHTGYCSDTLVRMYLVTIVPTFVTSLLQGVNFKVLVAAVVHQGSDVHTICEP